MALAALAALAGAAVQSASGFGFALVASPALLAVMEPAEAVTTLLVLGFALNALVLREAHASVRWDVLPPLLVAALPGLAVGAAVLSALSREPLQVGVGVAVVAAAAWQLRHRAAGSRVPAALAGFASGALTTSISISGPPLVLWLEARRLTPGELRATLAAAFLALNLAGGAVLMAVEGGDALDPGAVGMLLAVVLVGYVLGAAAFRRIDERRFSTVVLVLVACTGVASIVAGLA